MSIDPSMHKQSPLRVLLVDDNTDNLRVLYETLDGQGFDLRVAIGGNAALEAARNAPPDLVLLDIAMPEMDGFEVCRRMKSEDGLKSAAIIFLSAFDDTEAKVRGLRLGAVDFVSKPFQPDEVLARVRTHLTIHQLQQQLSRRNQELEEAHERLTHANKKMSDALAAAARVQQALLPSESPDCRNARFAWEYVPCDELAGDFLNVLPLSERHIGVYVADVSGHGVASSLLSVTIARVLTAQVSDSSLLVRSHPDKGSVVVSPADVAAELNRRFPMEEQGGLYFTILYGVLDLESLEFRFVSAGHAPVVCVRAGGSAKLLEGEGFAVGWYEDIECEEQRVQLQAGDRLYLYSDGVPEAMNGAQEEFGVTRMLDTIESTVTGPLAQSVASLSRAVEAWCERRPKDDVSILGLQIAGEA